MPSSAAASTAAGAPYTRSTRKMKISPPAMAVLAPGMRTGKRPAMAATNAPASTCSSTSPSNCPTLEMA